MLSDESVFRQLSPGRSLLVGTADASGWPACCRAVALRVHPDRQGLTLYLPVATGAEAVANIASTRRVAIVASDPVSHESLQLKGRTQAVRVAEEEEAGLVEEYFERLTDVLDAVGLPRAVSRTLTRWPAFAIEVSVEAVFEQTPGPRAGSLLRSR